MLIFHLWFIVFINVLHCQRPSLDQEYGSLTLSFKDPQGDVDIGSTIFNNMFWSSASHIIYRYCPTCADTHKHIYYKRLTDLDTFDLYSNIYIWTDSNNILHDDFDLYSTANDVLNDINRWNTCDYNDINGKVGFPRNCGPNSGLGCNFVSRDAYYDQFNPGCSKEAYFYIYRGTVRKFTYFSTIIDRTTAEANCANLGQTLAIVKNDHDIQAVANLGAINTNFWIGLYEPSQTNNEWAWDDGSQCENELGPSIFISSAGMRTYDSRYCFNYWPTNEPNGGTEQCAYMSLTAAGTLWRYSSSNDWGCVNARSYVCSDSTIPNPAVDCIKGSTYSDWSGCDAACDQTGEEKRIRSGDIPAVNGGAECSNVEEKRSCIGPACAVNCVLGDWYDNGECSDICGGGLINQHRDVDTYPAHGGTVCGLQEQEVACNEQECCPAPGIGTFDWDKMTGQGEDVPDFKIIEFKGYDTDLTLNIVVELEYVGKTKANNHREAKFGTTYVLDFEDFDAHSDKINEPGTCQNRMSSSFTNIDFNDMWTYSTEPQNSNGIGSPDTLAYPPSDKWTMKMKDDGCDTIIYERRFTWDELRGCKSFDGTKKYTDLEKDDTTGILTLSGVLYINVVSPMVYNSDLGYYRVYQLLSQPWVITLSTTVHVLGSTGINLFTMWIIAVYKENMENDFRLVVMTESAEYLTLKRENNEIFEFMKDTSNLNIIDDTDFTVYDTPEAGCLNNPNYICTQLWNIDLFDAGCTDTHGTDFSGEYTLGFTPECKDPLDTHCNIFLDDHPDIANSLTLSADLTWKDSICNPILFELQFLADMLFYINNQFIDGTDIATTHAIDGTDRNSYLYEAGVDNIYVEIDTRFPDQTFEIFDTVLKGVWICTFPVDIIPKTFHDVIDKNQNVELGNMGCFSNDKDDSLASVVFDIFPIPQENTVEFETYPELIEDIIRFSFKIPEEVSRDTLYIHAEIEVVLKEPIQPRRRILLEIGTNTANQIGHFGNEIGIKHNNNNNNKPLSPANKPLSPANNTWIIIIGCVVSFLLILNICFMYYKYNKGKHKGYKSVKPIDSEFDSEVQMLNN